MNNTETELNNMIAQANAVISNAEKKPIGYPGWWSQQHLFSMITAAYNKKTGKTSSFPCF